MQEPVLLLFNKSLHAKKLISSMTVNRRRKMSGGEDMFALIAQLAGF